MDSEVILTYLGIYILFINKEKVVIDLRENKRIYMGGWRYKKEKEK